MLVLIKEIDNGLMILIKVGDKKNTKLSFPECKRICSGNAEDDFIPRMPKSISSENAKDNFC